MVGISPSSAGGVGLIPVGALGSHVPRGEGTKNMEQKLLWQIWKRLLKWSTLKKKKVLKIYSEPLALYLLARWVFLTECQNHGQTQS